MENKNPDEITADELAKITTSIAEADSFLRLSNYEKAEELYTNALPYFPSNAHILISRSQCRVLRGDYKGAEKDADALLTLDPKSTKAILCKANSLFANGDFEMAMVNE
jgi:tetratricopeptide (TPR) repeat protein